MAPWRNALRQQFGAAIDTLENALLACPDALWEGRMWRDHAEPSPPAGFAEFWYIAYHTLFWLDLYLAGSAEGFAPPAPFTLDELDPAGVLPERPYTKDELLTYLAHARMKCQSTLAALTDEQARRPCAFPWSRGQDVSFVELLLYNMRHVQEHAAQLHMFLGQHAHSAAATWVARTGGERGGA